ncbi:MAG: ABC transporter permease [Chloroflexi bacterium]|nr:ABC transporter permease [Chloroflexota bacterium]
MAAIAVAERHAVAPARRGRRWVRRMLRNWGALAGLTVASGLVLMALLAPVIAPFDPNTTELLLRNQPPFQAGSSNLLGTDQLGRDILSRIIYGSRVSLIVGLVAVAISGAIGVFLGLISGFYSGWLDDFLSWLTNVQLSFPFVLLAIAVIAVLGPGLRNIIVVLGVTSWVVYARIVRGVALGLRESDFVAAARTLGASDARILFSHILPNALTPMIVIASFEFARMIILEASLSFLGLGVETSIPSWGGMLADGRAYLSTAWWLATFPGLAITTTVLGINLLGDWLRDELDPRLRSLG